MTIHATIAETAEDDFLVWLAAQSAALRNRDTGALDWDALAEEIDVLGRSQRTEASSRLVTILEHLLKLEFGLLRDPARGWADTVRTQRRDLLGLLALSPSIGPDLPDYLARAYPVARTAALKSFVRHEPANATHYRANLPENCPFTLEAVLDEDFFSD